MVSTPEIISPDGKVKGEASPNEASAGSQTQGVASPDTLFIYSTVAPGLIEDNLLDPDTDITPGHSSL